MSDTIGLHKLSLVETGLIDVNKKLTIRLDVRVEAEVMAAIIEYGRRHKWKKSQVVRELVVAGLVREGFLKNER